MSVLPAIVLSALLLAAGAILKLIALIITAGVTEHSASQTAGQALMVWLGGSLLLDLLVAAGSLVLMLKHPLWWRCVVVAGTLVLGLLCSGSLLFVGMVLMNR